jgi:hypothetical protein
MAGKRAAFSVAFLNFVQQRVIRTKPLTPATSYAQTLAASFNWTEMRQLFFGTILLVMFSCDTKSSDKNFVEYVDGGQLLTANEIKRNGEKIEEPRINLVTPDSARIGEEFLAKIFLSGTELRIVDAFVDCENVDNASVDTVTYKISSCKHGLLVKDDTILVAFRPTTSGLKKFSEITILTKGADKVFRTMRYTFDYKVAEN